jgi:hypothetical protein
MRGTGNPHGSILSKCPCPIQSTKVAIGSSHQPPCCQRPTCSERRCGLHAPEPQPPSTILRAARLSPGYCTDAGAASRPPSPRPPRPVGPPFAPSAPGPGSIGAPLPSSPRSQTVRQECHVFSILVLQSGPSQASSPQSKSIESASPFGKTRRTAPTLGNNHKLSLRLGRADLPHGACGSAAPVDPCLPQLLGHVIVAVPEAGCPSLHLLPWTEGMLQHVVPIRRLGPALAADFEEDPGGPWVVLWHGDWPVAGGSIWLQATVTFWSWFRVLATICSGVVQRSAVIDRRTGSYRMRQVCSVSAHPLIGDLRGACCLDNCCLGG